MANANICNNRFSGFDLRACVEEAIQIEPGQTVLVKTGMAIYIEDTNFAGLVLPRSGLAISMGSYWATWWA